MADYIINYSDTSKSPFTIKPYTTNGPELPSALTPLATKATSASTSLILLGQGMYQYGEMVAEDFVHLLENFAAPTAPVYPIEGQLWYKNDTNEMYIHDGTGFNLQILVSGGITADFDMSGFKIINLGSPTNPGDAVNLGYTDATYVELAGDTMTGSLILAGDPTLALEAATKQYVDALETYSNASFLLKAGDTMTGPLNMNSNFIVGLPDPTLGNHAVTLNYLTTNYVPISGGIYLELTGGTLTGPLYINGALMYSGSTLTVIDANTSTNTITVSGGDFSALFGVNVQFKTVLNASSGYQVVNVGGTKIGTDPTGLANDATVYTASIDIDGVANPIAVTGSAAQTFTDLINEINADLSGAIAAIVDGNLRVTSLTSGSTSTILITDTDLFLTLTGYVAILTAINGADTFAGTLTTLSSTYNAPNTEITTVEALTVASTSGSVSYLPGLSTIVDAVTELNGNLFVTSSSYTLDFGGSRLQNIFVHTYPEAVNVADAASIQYVNDAVAASSAADGTLSSATFFNNTLTLNSTIGGPVTVDGLLGINDTVQASQVNYRVYNDSVLESPVRDALYNKATNYVPNTTLNGLVEAITQLFNEKPTRNDRSLFIVPAPYTITGVSDAMVADGTISAVNISTSGYQEVDVGGAVIGTDPTGLSADTSGYQEVDVGGTKTGGSATGLTNDLIVYTATIDVDGVANPIAITGQDAQTYTDLLTQLNADLTGATASLQGGNLRVTSNSTGLTSTISITNVNLFSTLTDYAGINAAVPGTHPTYTATITVDGVANPVSVEGDISQTYDDLIFEINADLIGATASLIGGNLVITSDSSGSTSTILIADVDLFSTLTTYVAINGAVAGTDGSIDISGGDFTSTFIAGFPFVVTGNTGLGSDTTFTTSSSSHLAGTTTIVITVPVPIAMTADGVIEQPDGAIVIGGDQASTIYTGSTVVIAGNGGAGNGTYLLSSTSTGLAADTFLLMDSSTPLPAGTTVSGTVAIQSLPTTFEFYVETNKLQVFHQGVKQYNSVRGISELSFVSPVLGYTPTDLAAGAYSFNITVDGGAPGNIPVTVSYVTDAVTNVDLVNNTWSVSNLPNNSFIAERQIQVVGNTGLGATTTYTIRSIVSTITETIITVYETINPSADISGSIRYPYTYNNLTDDIQTSIQAVYPTNYPVIALQDGNWLVYSPTSGTGSSIVISDVSLLSAVGVTINNTYSTGVSYGYQELGVPLEKYTLVTFNTLPTVGDVYEFINIR